MSASEAASNVLAPFGLKAEPPKPLNIGVRPRGTRRDVAFKYEQTIYPRGFDLESLGWVVALSNLGRIVGQRYR